MNNSIFAKLLKLNEQTNEVTNNTENSKAESSVTKTRDTHDDYVSREAKRIDLEASLKEFLTYHWPFMFPLEHNEVDEFVALQNKCLPSEKYDADLVNYLLSSALVYKLDGKIVGGILIGKTSNKSPAKAKYESKKGFIETVMSLFVDEQHRGKKIGKALLYAALHGFEGRCMMLHVRWRNKPAIELYKKVGFLTLQRIHKYYREPTEDAWEMVFIREQA